MANLRTKWKYVDKVDDELFDYAESLGASRDDDDAWLKRADYNTRVRMPLWRRLQGTKHAED